MRNLKAEMFNRKASNPRNMPDSVIEALGIEAGHSVADIGAGGGYFTFRFAEIAGDIGMVYAVDSNPEFLNFIEESARERGLNNISTVLHQGDVLALPEGGLNLIFMRNVTHHIEDRVGYLANLGRFLKEDGRVAIIEYKKGGILSFRRLFGHYIPLETIKSEMEDAGYTLIRKHDFLPEQHFTIYSK